MINVGLNTSDLVLGETSLGKPSLKRLPEQVGLCSVGCTIAERSARLCDRHMSNPVTVFRCQVIVVELKGVRSRRVLQEAGTVMCTLAGSTSDRS